MSWDEIVAPSSQHASSTALSGLFDAMTYSAAFSQPSPAVIRSTAFTAPSVPSLPNGRRGSVAVVNDRQRRGHLAR